MKKAFVLIAEGFEEGESLETIDVLRRCGIECCSVSINLNEVSGCNEIKIITDHTLDSFDPSDYDMVILPGGMPGAENLKNDARVIKIVKEFDEKKKYVCAICAAPMVLKEAGITKGRILTSYPADKYRNMFEDSNYIDDEIVVVDDNLITSRGPATVFPFAYILAKVLGGDIEQVQKKMLYDKVVESYQNL